VGDGRGASASGTSDEDQCFISQIMRPNIQPKFGEF
jgi:hypothetical protein